MQKHIKIMVKADLENGVSIRMLKNEGTGVYMVEVKSEYSSRFRPVAEYGNSYAEGFRIFNKEVRLNLGRVF